jgi:hypothetical protein
MLWTPKSLRTRFRIETRHDHDDKLENAPPDAQHGKQNGVIPQSRAFNGTATLSQGLMTILAGSSPNKPGRRVDKGVLCPDDILPFFNPGLPSILTRGVLGSRIQLSDFTG